MADKERSGVLGTMDQAMLPFKNKAVKERTSACDFTSMDLRGMKDPDTGEWLPVTLYICVNQAEAQAFANITALLYEVLSRDFLSYGPGEKDKRGRIMGPKTICFMMDEFAKLPKSETVLTGPDLGRSKKVSYWLIFQARSQIIKTYSKEDGTTIDSTCGVTILLSQNDPETAAHYVKTVGKTTIRKQSYSRNAGLSKTANPWARNESIASEGVDFLRSEDITAMKPGTHLILPQNFLNRPMKVASPFFFEDPNMLAKVFNPRTGKGPRPANPLPEHIRIARHLEWIEKQTRQQEIEAAAQEKGMQELSEGGGEGTEY
jgi:type IV secretion system protein VirD4